MMVMAKKTVCDVRAGASLSRLTRVTRACDRVTYRVCLCYSHAPSNISTAQN